MQSHQCQKFVKAHPLLQPIDFSFLLSQVGIFTAASKISSKMRFIIYTRAEKRLLPRLFSSFYNTTLVEILRTQKQIETLK